MIRSKKHYGLYTRGANEQSSYVYRVEMPTLMEAEAYFAGMKRLPPEQLHNLFIIREIDNTNNKNLLLG
tara:strand:- start:1027 stop:1233 length:207 start_codon:yes stop_codon:yes gene_type:complete